MINSTKLILYRMMRADANNNPLLPTSSTSRDCLGVRFKHIDKRNEPNPKVDVYIDDDGMVVILEKEMGMSLTIPPLENIPEFMLDPVRQLVRYVISRSHFDQNEHLMYIEDSAKHAMLVPRHAMHIDELNQYLADTVPLWEVDDDDDKE